MTGLALLAFFFRRLVRAVKCAVRLAVEWKKALVPFGNNRVNFIHGRQGVILNRHVIFATPDQQIREAKSQECPDCKSHDIHRIALPSLMIARPAVTEVHP
jgi:hypothetical protein